MLHQFGGLLGWLILWSYVGTLLNYVLKFVNKQLLKTKNKEGKSRKLPPILMKIFVRNHKYFGIAAFTFLILHFILQFITYGLNITGGIAASLICLQLFLGVYAVTKKRPRKGLWFNLHRVVAVLLVLGILIHINFPYLIKASTTSSPANSTTSVSPTSSSSSSQTSASDKIFTLEELATYNGQNGQPAYVAYNGIVYDVSDNQNWKNGKHNGEKAGTDLTNDLSRSPHGDSVFKTLPVVGSLAAN